jgi:hypothetical protein
MKALVRCVSVAIVALAASIYAAGQSPTAQSGDIQGQTLLPAAAPLLNELGELTAEAAAVAPAIQPLLDFKASDAKFDLAELMEVLRDRRHEGWVLAAYPDPKTSRPLIGAGFSLDLPAREHSQRNLLNPHPFVEPSSAELWRAAGLSPERLQKILEQYNTRQAAWSKKRFRKEIRNLDPQITDEDATLLLRISAIQAIYNARAYCRDFDNLSASQQMAVSQLVYQMGVNLEEFSQFLSLINRDNVDSSQLPMPAGADPEYWKTVQLSLVQSQWARAYRGRAISVIAMLDPRYTDNPTGAERRVSAVLAPAVVHRRRGRSVALVQVATHSRHRSVGEHKIRSRRRSR